MGASQGGGGFPKGAVALLRAAASLTGAGFPKGGANGSRRGCERPLRGLNGAAGEGIPGSWTPPLDASLGGRPWTDTPGRTPPAGHPQPDPPSRKLPAGSP
ncbi:hypothetical protein GCM10009864_71600 [Streptomyces lunalinharesii]|uniref:Uncharacterized protein n=1 Tax=Streptomyces lunalinharesii TaxID=333384 RepID=A0ABN3SW32_9ACTN